MFFADNSNFLIACKNTKEFNRLINFEIKKIKGFLDANGLSINTGKTTYLHFVPKGKKKTNLELKIGNRTIQEVNHLRFLGVYIDNRLSFNEHFKKVLNKVQNGLRGLIMSKHILSYRAKLNVYHALIHSHLSYCAIIWLDSLNSKQLNQLKIIQKKMY